jgi:hypothetical protein
MHRQRLKMLIGPRRRQADSQLGLSTLTAKNGRHRHGGAALLLSPADSPYPSGAPSPHPTRLSPATGSLCASLPDCG